MEGLEELITARKWTNGSTLVRLAYPKLLPSLSHASPTPLSSPPEALLTPLSSLLLDPRFILIVLVVLCVLCAFSAWELVGGVLWDPKTPKPQNPENVRSEASQKTILIWEINRPGSKILTDKQHNSTKQTTKNDSSKHHHNHKVHERDRNSQCFIGGEWEACEGSGEYRSTLAPPASLGLPSASLRPPFGLPSASLAFQTYYTSLPLKLNGRRLCVVLLWNWEPTGDVLWDLKPQTLHTKNYASLANRPTQP